MHTLVKPLFCIKKLVRLSATVIFIAASLVAFSQSAHAALLPTVTGVSFDGERISWDSMDGATGYNIYLDARYARTVRDATEFVPTSTGLYTITAFDRVGNVSPLVTFDPTLPPRTNFTVVDELNNDPTALMQSALQNVRGTLYSANAGEVFWGRVDSAFSISYQVSINGELAGRTIGTSFWMPDLRTDEITEVTISTNGDDIYGPGSVTLLLDPNTNDFPAPATIIENPTDDDDNEPEAPVSTLSLPTVTGVSFDGTRVTWDAVEDAVGYNIYIDGRYTHTVRDTTEFIADRTGRYLIVAFDQRGFFSPTINTDSTPTTNRTLVGSINSDAIEPLMDPLETARASVYSKTAGEIFWDRNNTDFSGVYVITVDGEQVARSFNSSIVLSDLPRNKEVRVTISAQESGVEVAWVTFVFDTTATEFPFDAAIVDRGMGAREGYTGPSAVNAPPHSPELIELSSTEADIYWVNTVNDPSLSTEIYRDGVLIGVSDTTFFYDDTREPGTDYVYELVTVDPNGGRSESIFVYETAFGGDPETVANNLLDEIANVTKNNPHVQWYPLFRSIAIGDIPEELVEVSRAVDNDDELTTFVTTDYQCTNDDGSMSVQQLTDALSEDYEEYYLYFDGCELESAWMDGFVDIFTQDGLTEDVFYSMLIESEASQFFDGGVQEMRSQSSDARSIQYNVFHFEELGDSFLELIVTLDQRVEYVNSDGSGLSTLETEFWMSSDITKGRELRVETETQFSVNESSGASYQTGSLTIEDIQNREYMTLSADTGDNANWYAEIFNQDGSTGVTGNWSDDNRLACIVFDGNCQ